MSSTERAPEPTMEEILASIRRIISDDESSTVRQRTASASQQDDEGLEAAEGEADDAIINDIARVLGGTAPAAEEEEDILDLTAELGGMEIVEETVIVEAVPDEAAFEPEVSQPAPAAPAAPQPEAQAPAPPAPPLTASEEAASALERAIAALRAGHVPTSLPEFGAQPEPEPQPESLAFVAAHEPEPEPEPELAPEPEMELVLTEFEAEMIGEEPVVVMIVEEPAVVEATMVSEPAESPAWEGDTAPWAGAPEPLVDPERPTARGNGAGAYSVSPLEAAHKTLEDSVKDMLRPMLRQWLNENMPRVLTAVLKDELEDSSARGQGD
ncbi:MAG TPA: DUF2497 domain-containing protein [Methyloceanibacter sp.]|nr:DUF2497 domain-containing protein [Methyloceanibacter sp.]